MILSNQARCLFCGDTPYSAHVHDLTNCECGRLAVDGGMDYLKRCGDPDDYLDLSISMPDDVVDKCTKAIQESLDTGRNPLGVLCTVMRMLRDNGYDVDRGVN